MKPVLEKIPTGNFSFFVKRIEAAYLEHPWHYHPEYELVLIEKGYGMRFMGDHVDQFSDGDLVFIAPNLPHVWKNHKDFYKPQSTLFTRCVVIHFGEKAFGNEFFHLPEFVHLQNLFAKAKQGILIKEATRSQVIEKMITLHQSNGIRRIILLLEIFEILLSQESNLESLSSKGFANAFNLVDSDRINKVYQYVVQNFSGNIQIEEIIKLVNMTQPSFCRYFKSRTGKTFTGFVNDIRISYACKLLQNNELTINQIAYECGFGQAPYFIKLFKKQFQKTPLEYREVFGKGI